MTNALAALGLLCVVTSGAIDRQVIVLLALGAAGAFMVPDRYQTYPWLRQLGTYGSLTLLGVQAARLMWGSPALTVAVEFAAALQIVRLATRRGAAHDHQVVLLALLHLIAGSVLGGGLAYGICFIGFLLLVPGALVLSHLRREVEGNYRQGARDRTGLPVDVPRILRSRRVISRRFLTITCALSIPIFLFTALLFVLFPRVGLSLLLLNQNRSERMVGFSDRVDLGKVGRLRSDPTIAVRVFLKDLPEQPAPRLPLYLRGTAFDTYDGLSWSRDRSQVSAAQYGERVWIAPPHSPLGEELMTLDLEPIKPPVVFLPSNTAAFDLLSQRDNSTGAAPRVTRGRELDFEYQTAEDRGLRYRVFGPQPGSTVRERLLPSDRARYLSLPEDLPERVRHLASQWAHGANDHFEIAKRIEARLRQDYRYSVESNSGAALNPLDHFLFESREGHCEFYSTSMAILLRTLGVPTRNVTGFVGGTFNRFGDFYAVRQGDAHSWVEVFIERAGWLRFDPTPATESAPRAATQGFGAFVRDVLEAATERWARNVVGYDLNQQVHMLSKVRSQVRRSGLDRLLDGKTVAAVFALLLAGGLAFRFRHGWRTKPKTSAPKFDVQRSSDAEEVVRLYRDLESLMQAHGVPRRTETPPLSHAMGLKALEHPLADDVLALTRIYLAVRFGRAPLTAEQVADFQQRVKAMKQLATPKAA
jgi:protein-glutamine gamma-glutamyltransferase